MRNQRRAAPGRVFRLGLTGLLGLGLACGGPSDDPAESGGASSPAAPVGAPSQPPALPAPTPPPAPPPPPTVEQLAALQSRAEAAPDDKTARRTLAIGLFAAHRRAEAVAEFEKNAESGDDPTTLIDLGNAYGLVSRMDDAAATYRKVLALVPGNATALFSLGEVAFLRGDATDAIALYRRALAARPEYPLAHYRLARALEHRGDFREAYTTYAAVLEFDPTTPEDLVAYDDALYRMASLDIAMGAHERAEGMLVALLEANPNHPAAHYAYGQVLLLLGRLAEAQQQLESHMIVRASRPTTTQVATGD